MITDSESKELRTLRAILDKVCVCAREYDKASSLIRNLGQAIVGRGKYVWDLYFYYEQAVHVSLLPGSSHLVLTCVIQVGVWSFILCPMCSFLLSVSRQR